ncbi:MAG: hypothetical protein SFU86_01125 [Pirellulaceae bacterium]|nr:hypothetical protein [Pirellulaceae bacterium]
MMAFGIRRSSLWGGLLLLGVALATAAEPHEPLRYRRILVPESEIDGQVRGLLPLKRDEFERRVAAATARKDALLPAAEARLERAEYRARLEGEQLIDGVAKLTIALAGEPNSWLTLDPLNLPLAGGAWTATGQPATCGQGPDDKLACQVPASGELQLQWSLRGRRDLQDLLFDFVLPAAPISQMRLELPVDCAASGESGVLVTAGQRTGDYRAWLCELGGRNRAALRVTRGKPAAAPPPVVLVREATTYVVSQSTIDVDVSLDLEVLHRPLRQIMLLVDEALQTTTIQQGSQPLDWTPLPVVGGQRRLLVELPTPLLGAGHALQISGTAAWAAPGDWRLPRIQLAEGTWQEGRTTISAAAPLALSATPHGGCRQTAYSPASPSRPTDQFQFQSFLPDAHLTIRPSAARPALLETSGLQLQFDSSQVAGTLIAELSAGSGERFEIEGLLPQRWVVDSVDVQPAEFLEDRTLAPRGPGRQSLRLALRRPLVEGRTLRVAIKAHCRRPPLGEPLSREVLELVQFAEARHMRRFVSLRSLDPAVNLRLAHDAGLVRLDPQTLPPAQARLFDSVPGPVLYEQTCEADSLQAILEPASPRFQAQTLVQAYVEQSQIRQRMELRIEPESSAVSLLEVRVWPHAEAIRWTLVGERSRELVARRISGDAASGEDSLWQLDLQQPQAGPCEIVGELTLPFDREQSLALIALPAASSQTGTIEVHAAGDLALSLTPREAVPLALPDAGADRYSDLRGLYSYEPGRRAELHVSRLAAAASLPLGLVESLTVIARFGADGAGDHETVVILDNRGRSQFSFRLPREASEVRATIEGQAGFVALAHPQPLEYAVPLPAGRQRVVVRIRYGSPPTPLGHWPRGEFLAPRVQTDWPVLQTREFVQLAPGLALTTEGAPAPASDRSAGDATLASWNCWELEAAVGPLSRIRVYRPAMVTAWAWCLALAAVAVAWPIFASRVDAAFLAAGLACACAMAVGPLLKPLAEGIAWGLFAAAILLLVRPRRLNRRVLSSDVGSTVGASGGVSRAAARVFTLLLLFLALQSAWAAPPATDAVPRPIWRVVIPTDDRQQPIGDYVYLDAGLYDALHQADRGPNAERTWLLAAAEYRLAGLPQGDAPRRTLDGLVARIDLETFTANVVVPLGFQRTEVQLIEGRALLDGKPVQCDWSPDGRQLRLEVATPGKHRLELGLGAAAIAAEDGVRLDLQIPVIAASRLIATAAAADALRIESATGRDAPVDLAAEHAWQLGPASKLALFWPAAGNPADRPARLEAEQLLLWKVRPGSVVVEGKFRARPVGGKLSEVVLRCDSRLHLLPLDPALPVARHWVEEGTSSAIHLVLREPATSEIDLRLSLLWVGSSGIGNVALPEVKIAADELTRQWTAVSLAAGLEWESAPAIRAGGPTGDDFAAVWSQPLPTGILAWDAAGRAPPLSIRPRLPATRAEQKLDCSFAARSAVVRYSARLVNLSPDVLGHRLTASAGLRVKRLTVLESDRPVAARWTQEPDGTIITHLAQPSAAEQRLDIEGVLDIAANTRRLPLPLLGYSGAAESSLEVRIDRQADVLVALQPAPKGWNAVADPGIGQTREGLGRLVAAVSHSGPVASGLVVTLAPNEPETTGRMVLRVDRDGGGWFAVADCLLEVTGGQLDVLRLRIPSQWVGPLETTPAVEQRLLSIPGESARHLVIRPQRSIAGPLRLTIRGPLRGGGAELVSAPDASVLDAPRVERIVVLPGRGGTERLAWETSGLQAIAGTAFDLPAGLIPPGNEAFQVVAPRFSATARLLDRPTQRPAVRLADYELRFTGQRLVGTARFDVAPGSARQVPLELPPGQELVRVAVDGTPAQLVRTASRQWQIGLIADALPQRVEIVFSGGVGAGPDERLAVPHLGGLSVAKTNWTIAGASASAREVVTPASLQLLSLARLEAAAAALADLSGRAADGPPLATLHAWGLWMRRYAEQRTLIRAASDESAVLGQIERLAAAENMIQKSRERLFAAGLKPVDPAVGAMTIPEPQSTASYFTAMGSAAPQLAMAAADPEGDRGWLQAGLLAAACLALWLVGRGPRGVAWLARQAHLVLGLVGIAWLAAGPLSWLGWGLLVLAAWLAWRLPFAQRTSEPLSSVVRRATR